MTQEHTQSDQEGNERSRVRQAVLVPLDGGGRLVAVRVNDAATQWAHRDVLEVVFGGRAGIIILPKVTSPDHVVRLDLLATR